MKSLLKYLGPIMLLIGTALLTMYFFNNSPKNTILIIAAALMVSGLITYVVTNKYIQD